MLKQPKHIFYIENNMKKSVSIICEGYPSIPLTKIVIGSINVGTSGEIETSVIGEHVMNGLKDLDHVAYIRFASVYRSFTDLSSFEKEVKNLINQTTGEVK